MEPFDCLVLLAWDEGWHPRAGWHPMVRAYHPEDMYEAWVQQVTFSMTGYWTALFRLGAAYTVTPGAFEGFPPEVVDQAASQLAGDSASGEWEFDKMWPDTNPASGQ